VAVQSTYTVDTQILNNTYAQAEVQSNVNTPISFSVQAAWNDGPDAASPTWYEIASVERIETGPRGRTYELDTIVPTRSKIRIDNTSNSYGPKQRTNLMPYATFWSTSATSYWAPVSGTLTRTSATMANGNSGYVGRYVASAGGSGIRIPYTPRNLSLSVSQNTTYTVQTKIRQQTAGTYGWNVYLEMYDSSGTSTGGFYSPTYVTSVNGSWVTLSQTFLTSPNTAKLYIEFNPTAALPSGATFDFDQIMVEASSTAGTFFDGSSANCAWNGTQYASASVSLSTATTDKQIRAIATFNGTPYRILTGNIESIPATLDSGQFDYASSTYGVIDRQDQLLTTSLRAAYIEWTMHQSPTVFVPFSEPAATSGVRNQVTGEIFPFVAKPSSGSGITAFTLANLGDSPMFPVTNPATCCNFVPYIDSTSSTYDAGTAVVLATGGTGTFVRGSQYAIRFTFRTLANSGYFFSQGDNYQINIGLSGGHLVANFPTTSGQTNLDANTTIIGGQPYEKQPYFNDGFPHVVELRISTSRQSLYVDGVETAFSTFTPSTISPGASNGHASDHAYIGYEDPSRTPYWGPFSGSISDFAIFDSSYITTYSAANSSALTLVAANGFATDTIKTRIGRILDWIDPNIPRATGTMTCAATPTITNSGIAETTTYYYRISANLPNGETCAGDEGVITTGAAILSSSRYNVVTWPAVTGAVSYNVYRSTVSGAELKIASNLTSRTYNDQSSATGSSSPLGPLTGPLVCAGVNAWQACSDAMLGDGGLLYIDAFNSVTTMAASDRLASPSALTLGTTLWPIASTNLTFEVDRQHLVNEIVATYPGGPSNTYKDSVSQSRYRRRTSASTITFPVASDTALSVAANNYLARYAYPRARIGSITLDVFTNPSLIPYVMNFDPGEKVTITNLPATAPATTMDFHIEGVTHQITATSWQTILQLSPYIPN